MSLVIIHGALVIIHGGGEVTSEEDHGTDDGREARREPRTGVEELPFRPGAGISAHDPEAPPPLGRTRHRAANVLVLDNAPP